MTMLHSAARVTLLVALAGCHWGPGPSYPRFEFELVDDTAEPVTEPPGCHVDVVASVPRSGARDVDYRTSLMVRLSWPDPGATFRLERGRDGLERPLGEPRWWERTAVLDPIVPLEPRTAHTLTVTLCGGRRVVEIPFVTSDTGEPVAVEDLVGRTYVLDALAPSVWFSEPGELGTGLGTGLLASMVTVALAIRVTSTDDGFGLQLGAVAEGRQEPCVEAGPVGGRPEDVREGPYFRVGVPGGLSLPLPSDEGALRLEGVEVAGTFAPRGTAVHGIRVAAYLDARSLAPWLGEVDDPGRAGCATLQQVAGLSCAPCPDGVAGGAPVCLRFALDGIPAWPAEVDLVERTAEVIAADPACR